MKMYAELKPSAVCFVALPCMTRSQECANCAGGLTARSSLSACVNTCNAKPSTFSRASSLLRFLTSGLLCVNSSAGWFFARSKTTHRLQLAHECRQQGRVLLGLVFDAHGSTDSVQTACRTESFSCR